MLKNCVIALLAAASIWMGIALMAPAPQDRAAHAAAPEPDPAYAGVTSVIEGMLVAPEFSGAAIGFCLLGESGELAVGASEGIAMIPASVFKTLTSATALELVGPQFRFETRLQAAAPMAEDGSLAGDLVIVGSGDPMLDEPALAAWVAELQAAGLKRIDGRVAGDPSCFPEQSVGEFWGWGDVGNGYGSPASGLNFHHNRYVAEFQPADAVGVAAVFLGVEPEVPGVQWDVAVTTAAAGSGDGVMIYGGPGATQIRIRGTVPVGGVFAVTGAVPDPARYAAYHLDTLLRAAGVEIALPPSGGGAAPEGAVTLATHESVPLIDIVRSLHEVSDNHETECLFRLLGLRAGTPPEDVIRGHWLERGLDLRDCRIVDGSGLGRADTIPPRDLAKLLYLVRRGGQGEAFYGSLNAGYDGAVRSKAGAMSGVRCYTGFVTGAESGREFTFALMLNHYRDGGAIAPWRDRLMRAMLSL